jgi:hypothetical protein
MRVTAMRVNSGRIMLRIDRTSSLPVMERWSHFLRWAPGLGQRSVKLARVGHSNWTHS